MTCRPGGYASGWREARRRLAEATELGPRTALTGQPLPPVLARVAAAQAAGSIGGEHVTVLRTFFDRLPIGVDSAPANTPSAFGEFLGDAAATLGDLTAELVTHDHGSVGAHEIPRADPGHHVLKLVGVMPGVQV